MNHGLDDIVVTGMGIATARGFGLNAHWEMLRDGVEPCAETDYSMKAFDAAKHLPDRRLLKAISTVDAYGLAAIASLKAGTSLGSHTFDSERVGLYVGAPPASAFDNEYYADAIVAAGEGGVREFGRTSMFARPTTLLVGLPNNVLCYGALSLDAKGPNSNYTSSSLSAHLALQNAVRRVKRGVLDLAVAGGFQGHTEPVNTRMFARLGLLRQAGADNAIEPFGAGSPGTIVADGAAFVSIERRETAEKRGAHVLATYVAGAMANDARGPLMIDESGEVLESTIRRALAAADVMPTDVGLVFACATGVPAVDRAEFMALARIFSQIDHAPALCSTSRVIGNLLEAGGILELGLIGCLYDAGVVPEPMSLHGYAADSGFIRAIEPTRSYVIILRVSPWGEHSVVVARKE